MQQQILAPPLTLFSVAAPKDAAFLSRWEAHLAPLEHAGQLTCWSYLHLQAGDKRDEVQEQHWQQANVILLLLSLAFFATPDCQTMMLRFSASRPCRPAWHPPRSKLDDFH